jgi:oxygen-dependent protoporphyrinogen oxidase
MPYQGELQPLSLSPVTMLRTPLLSLENRMRLLIEPLIPRAPTRDESIAQFFNRRLGPGFTQAIIEPFVSGVYGGNLDDLSMRALFPRLWQMEQRHGSLLSGIIASSLAKDTEPPSASSRETFSFAEGLSTWTDALVEAIGAEHIQLNTTAVGLQPVEQRWQLTIQRTGTEEVVEADRVILAIPANKAAPLVAHLEPTATHALQTLAYPPLAVVHLAYPRDAIPHAMDAMGVLCPSQAQCNGLGMLWMSTIFPERAPDGQVLTTTFVGGARAPELARQNTETLISTVRQEHRNYLNVRTEPTLAQVVPWPRSIPQYDAAYTRRIAACNRLEARWPGLYLLSNYRQGFSVEQCWQHAQKVGESIVLVPQG